jgi:hypothetical protein
MYLTTYSESLKTFLLSEDVILKTPPIVIQPVTPEPRPTDKSKLPYVSANSFCDENYAGKWARTSSFGFSNGEHLSTENRSWT